MGRLFPLLLSRRRRGGLSYIENIRTAFGANLIAFWPLNETTGTTAFDQSGNARNGEYNGSPLLANLAGLHGEPAPHFDGTDYVNVYGAGFAGAFSSDAGTLSIDGKIAAAQWIDGGLRDLVRLSADASNKIYIRKNTTSNQLIGEYTAGGTADGVVISTAGTTDWFNVTITWDVNAGVDGQLLVYYNGTQSSTTQTALGTWAGALASTLCTLAAANTSLGTPHIGHLGNCIVLNRAATSAEVASIYSGNF